MKRLFLNLYANSLFRNSLYPMLGTAVMAGLGFFFWLFVAHLFTDEEVGIAAALISVMTTISAFSLVGFDTSTIRFLAHDKNKNANINTGMTVISLASIVLALGFLFLAENISPQLAFLSESVLLAGTFVVFTILTTINGFTDAIFLSFRETKYTFYINSFFSVVKVGLPFLFVGYGAFGIFAAAATAQAVGYVVSLIVLIGKYDFRPKIMLDKNVIRNVWKYSTGNYVADVFNFLPVALLPILITNVLGAEQAAYYYIVMMIIALLNVIPASAMRSLFAEGSFDQSTIKQNVREAIKITTLFLLPAMVVLLAGGSLILQLFGAQYVNSGIVFLNIMVLSGILVSFFMLYGFIFRLTGNIKALILRNAVFTTVLIVSSYSLLSYGLLGIGIAHVISYSFSLLLCLTICKKTKLI